MALAKKCDRCGKLYEHYPIGNQSGIFNGIKLVRIGENGSLDRAKNHNDLCPECMAVSYTHLTLPTIHSV